MVAAAVTVSMMMLLLEFTRSSAAAVALPALTLAGGQRIAPRNTGSITPSTTTPCSSSSDYEARMKLLVTVPTTMQQQQEQQQQERDCQPSSATLPYSYKSLFDLPRVEQWADERGLTEHHLKTIYHVVMQQQQQQLHAQLQQSQSQSQSPSNSDDDNEDGYSNHVSCSKHCLETQRIIEEGLLKQSFPKQHAADLLSKFRLCTSTLVETRTSAASGGGGSVKLVIRLQSGKLVETVLIKHHHRPHSISSSGNISKNSSIKNATSKSPRYTVCVSSQVGCARACSFCATGTLGLQAQLSSAEILEQVWIARSVLLQQEQYLNLNNGETNSADQSNMSKRMTSSPPLFSLLRNVVFMGMGEPLDNWPAVHEACRGLTHQCLFGFGARHVTISTVGASPDHIRLMADEAPQISLAVSLHSATQQLREALMPANMAKRASLTELESALDYHAVTTGLGVMIEYLLIAGVNDSDEAADALVDFCQRRRTVSSPHGSTAVYVNLIPYNPTIAGVAFGYQTPTDEAIGVFCARLNSLSSNNNNNNNKSGMSNINSRVRWSSAASRDTDGACGQLVVSVNAAASKKV